MTTLISRAGTCRRTERGPGSGFTLVEIMVVLLVIGIISALVIPRTGALDSVELRSAARNLAGTIRLAYSSSVMNHAPMRLCFNLDEQSYRIEIKQGKNFVQDPDPMLAPRKLPDNVFVKRVEAMDRVCDYNCEECINFSPGGYVEEAAVYLTLADDSQTVSLFTRPMTGRTVIVMEEMSREDWEKTEEGH